MMVKIFSKKKRSMGKCAGKDAIYAKGKKIHTYVHYCIHRRMSGRYKAALAASGVGNE